MTCTCGKHKKCTSPITYYATPRGLGAKRENLFRCGNIQRQLKMIRKLTGQRTGQKIKVSSDE